MKLDESPPAPVGSPPARPLCLDRRGGSGGRLRRLRPDQIRQELESTAEGITSLTGTRPTLWRPPYDSFNDIVTAIASSLGLSMRLWDVAPADFTMPSSVVSSTM